MKKNTGGPAFPCPITDGSGLIDGGMTLRDYFAAKALQGILAYPNSEGTMEFFATTAYKYADAMMEVRDLGKDIFLRASGGLIWKGADMVDAPEADKIAYANGYVVAERLVAAFNEKCFLADSVTLKIHTIL